jgi:drug/metabolite transporter (DMT)-like permease
MRSNRGLRRVLGDPAPPPDGPVSVGYGLGAATALVTAVAFISAKPVLEYLDPLSFSVSQFGIASVFAFLWLLRRRELGQIRDLTHGQWTFLFVISLLFLGAVYTMWIGLSSIPATAAALLNRLEVLVTVFLGMALLGDRFTRREGWGAFLAVLGMIVLRYDAPPSFSAGFWMMVLSSTLFGIIEVLVKTRVHAIPPRVFTFVRNTLVFVLFLVAAVWRVAMQEGPWWVGVADWPGIRRGLPLIAVTALVGPVLARTMFMYCLRYLEISRATLIQQAQPVFVAVLSSILLRALPSRREWVGGLLIVAGCLFLVQWSRTLSWRRRSGEVAP